MNNLTAVLLTMGEKTTQSAIESLNKQTVIPSELIIVENISPFHKALNHGVSKVNTEFFLQLDADMILDEDCILNLMNNMDDEVGIVMGQLRDPLMGAETGIKIFRTECFDDSNFKDSISPDTDLYNDILKKGWKSRRALYLSRKEDYGKYWFTFGDHLPEYTPVYVYRRYYLLGQRYRYRRDMPTFLWRLEQLESVNHNHSIIAIVSMCHGIFSSEETDQLSRNLYTENEDYRLLRNFLSIPINNQNNILNITKPSELSHEEIFSQYYSAGIELKKNNNLKCFLRYLQLLDTSLNSDNWIAKIAMCHGLFSEKDEVQSVEEKFGFLKELL